MMLPQYGYLAVFLFIIVPFIIFVTFFVALIKESKRLGKCSDVIKN